MNFSGSQMLFLKLQSSDGIIFSVDVETVNQLMTIKTMIDHENGENSEEVTPVPAVKAEILEKIIQWAECHKIDSDIKSNNDWSFPHSNLEMRKIFEIIIAADYLDVGNLLKECFHNLMINNKLKCLQEAAHHFHDSKVETLLDTYKLRNHGYEVFITIFDRNQLKYFDIKVGFTKSRFNGTFS